jgi:hypothetical protein
MIAGWIDPASGARRSSIESTVYPGVTEDICGPEIERAAGLVRGRDFRLGYSPERINPGDKVHSIDKIVKVVAGEDEEVLEQLAHLRRDDQRRRLPRGVDQDRRGGQGDRERPARHQHRLHERGRADLRQDRRQHLGRARRGADQVEFPRPSSRGWSAATASASILITSAIWRRSSTPPAGGARRARHQRRHGGVDRRPPARAARRQSRDARW